MYRAKQEKLQADIAQVARDIQDCKIRLTRAREELARQQEYEALKEEIVLVPARSVTRAEMKAVEKEISDLTGQEAGLEAVMEKRKGQFASILHVIEQVHQAPYADFEDQLEGGEEKGGDGDGDEEEGAVVSRDDEMQPMQE